MPQRQVTVHTARTVVPITRPPVTSGAVVVDDGAGSILAVGDREEMLKAHPSADVAGWDGVLLPGLVNAHTHLQYTSFAQVGARSYADYAAWADRFIAEDDARRGQGRDEDWGKTARLGAELALRSGTTCFADVVTDLGALGALADLDLPGVSYLELIAIDAAAWTSGVEAATAATLQAARMRSNGRAATVGLSPHALYSLEEPVLRGAAALARRERVRLHVHLAEAEGEDAYYRTGTGWLAERVARRVGRRWGILATGGTGLGPGGFALSRGLLGADSHVAHGVHLDAEGRALLRDTGTAVALCPRSNRIVGSGTPPVAAYLEEGNPIAVGTDSLASSPSLDLLEDVALLRRLAVDGGYLRGDLDVRLLHAATLGGARALGVASQLGSLEPGKRADLAVFAVEPAVGRVERALVESGAGRCRATIVAGTVRWTG